MGRHQASICSALVLACGLTVSVEASAEPVRQGTFMLGAERMASSNLWINGGTSWNNQFFGAPGITPFDTPRLGVDYFIIDGLSLGGHLGMGFGAYDGGGSDAWIAFLPRVGYAFSLSNTFDMWPRGGIGLIAGDHFWSAGDSGVLSFELMFLANIHDNFAIEFGPATDIPLGGFWPDAIFGANAGFVVRF